MKANKVDMIFATEMERLCRRPRETEDLIDLAEATTLREIYLTSDDGYDLSTPNGIYRARQAVNHAERESRKISERIRRKLDTRASEGAAHGGRRAYGYTSGGMEIDELEASRLREMGARVLRGDSCREVAYWANEQGYRTAEGKLWHPVTIQNSLRRVRYVGIREHNGAQYPATWPAIFDAATWDKIQLTLNLSADKYSGRAKGRKYLLTGLVYCGKCGMPLNGSTKQDGPGKPVRRVYVCRTEGTTQRRRGCGGVNRSAEALDHWITESVLYRLDTPDLAALLNQDDDNDDKLYGLLEDRTAQKRRLDGLVEDYASRLLTRDEFAHAKTIAQHELERIEADIDSLNRQRVGSGLVPVGTSLRTAWEQNDTDEWRRSLLALVIERIDVQPGGGKPFYFIDGKRLRFDPTRIDVTWRA